MKNSTRSFCEAHFNEICIVSHTVLARLIGFHEDRCDYYYTVRLLGEYQEEGKIIHYSAVGACVSLVNIPSHEHMDRIFTLNGCGQETEFRYTVASEEDNIAMYGPHDPE